jgi:plasmid stabilization system protein ParE
MMVYQLIISEDAQDDLERLHAFLFDLDPVSAERAMKVIEKSYGVLERFPHTCRKASDGEFGPSARELLINFGSSGYVALFEISDVQTVTVLAVRHQRENDYH